MRASAPGRPECPRWTRREHRIPRSAQCCSPREQKYRHASRAAPARARVRRRVPRNAVKWASRARCSCAASRTPTVLQSAPRRAWLPYERWLRENNTLWIVTYCYVPDLELTGGPPMTLSNAAFRLEPPSGDRHTSTLALLAFAMLIVSLDQYIVVVALPEIGRALGYSQQTLQAVISAYAVASAGFLLLGGRASDLLGRRRVLVSGLTLYAGGSLAGGLAQAPEVLLVARAVQGLGGALVFPATLALINTTFAEGPERNRAVAIWGGTGAAGLVVGVLLGGVLTQALGWEAVFFVNVPLAGVGA